jgi:hypothetical protein
MDYKGSSPWAVLYGVLGLTHVLGMGVLTATYIGGLLLGPARSVGRLAGAWTCTPRDCARA